MFGEATLCQDNTRGSLEEDLYFLSAAATTVWEKHWAGFVVSLFLGLLITSTTKSLLTFRRGKKYWPTYVFFSFFNDKQ